MTNQPVYFNTADQVAPLTVTFTRADGTTPTTPSVIAAVVTDPDGSSVTYSYTPGSPAANVVYTTGTGTFELDLQVFGAGAPSGLWTYVWSGAGGGVAQGAQVIAGSFRILALSDTTGLQRWYVSKEEVKSRLQISQLNTQDDYELQLAVQGVTDWITGYCVVPETLVLTADLRWVAAGDLVIGQELVGVDETPEFNAQYPDNPRMQGHRNRKYRRAVVLAAPRRRAECVRIILADGREVTSATDHGWLVRRTIAGPKYYALPPEARDSNYRWMGAGDIVPGDEIAAPLRTWPEEASFEAGWASGIMDGEGWLAVSGPGNRERVNVGVAQNPGLVLDRFIRYMDGVGLPYIRQGRAADKCERLDIQRRWAAMELLGRLRPCRLMPLHPHLWEGQRVIRSGPNSVRVVKTEDAGTREVVSLGTSTGTYIANGLISHNCGQHFYRVTEARTFAPRSVWELSVDPFVPGSITSFRLDYTGDGTFETSWTEGLNYQALRQGESYNPNAFGTPRPHNFIRVLLGSPATEAGGQFFPFTWPFTHMDRVQITATWGWQEVPANVQQAALMMAADLFKTKDAPWGIAGMGDLGLVKAQANPWIIELLRAYVNPNRKVGV